MADRGLSIEESLALKLNWQSLFLIKKKSQLDPKIRVIDNVCIQVERVIGLKYNILQRILPIDHLMSTRSSSYPMVDGFVIHLQIFVHQGYLLIESSINRPYSMTLVYQFITLGRYLSLLKMLY